MRKPSIGRNHAMSGPANLLSNKGGERCKIAIRSLSLLSPPSISFREAPMRSARRSRARMSSSETPARRPAFCWRKASSPKALAAPPARRIDAASAPKAPVIVPSPMLPRPTSVITFSRPGRSSVLVRSVVDFIDRVSCLKISVCAERRDCAAIPNPIDRLRKRRVSLQLVELQNVDVESGEDGGLVHRLHSSKKSDMAPKKRGEALARTRSPLAAFVQLDPHTVTVDPRSSAGSQTLRFGTGRIWPFTICRGPRIRIQGRRPTAMPVGRSPAKREKGRNPRLAVAR